MSKINHRAPPALELRSAALQFSTALARTAFFLAALCLCASLCAPLRQAVRISTTLNKFCPEILILLLLLLSLFFIMQEATNGDSICMGVRHPLDFSRVIHLGISTVVCLQGKCQIKFSNYLPSTGVIRDTF